VEGAGILRDDEDPGLLLQSSAEDTAVSDFIDAMAKHKHFVRENDPPML
jgi:catalase